MTESHSLKVICEFLIEEAGRQYQRMTGMDLASSTRAAENRTKWKGIVANSSLVPRRPSKVMG